MAEILILGVLISILFYELTDITPGGIIVPGLMVAYIGQPLRMVYTLFVAVLSYFIVKLLSSRFLIFGKRRFALLIIISFILHLLINLFMGAFIGSFSRNIISLIGYTAAGIIANNMFKQGVVKTSAALAINIGILELIIILLATLGVTV